MNIKIDFRTLVNTRKLFLIITFVCFIFSSCKEEIKGNIGENRKDKPEQKINEYKFENIDFDTTHLAFNLSEFCNKVNYVPLKNEQNSFIGEITKLESFDDKYFILDERFAKAVFVFNNKGDFLFKKKTNSEELISIDKISDFTIDFQNEHLIILAGEQKRILSFDIGTGKMIRSLAIPDYFNKIRVVDKSHYLLLRDGLVKYTGRIGNSRACVIDNSGNVKESFFNSGYGNKINFGSIFCTNKMNGQFLIARMLADTIWSYSENGIQPLYKITTPKINTQLFINANTSDEIRNAIANPVTKYISSYLMENDSLIIMGFKNNYSLDLGIIDKNTKRSRLYKYVKNDIDNIPISLPVLVVNGRLISTISMNMIRQYYSLISKENTVSEMSRKIKEFLLKYEKQSNPILVEIILK